MYRVRQRYGATRFFVCGEYGDISLRPHFHAILFGRSFADGVPCGKDIFSSAELSQLWRFGFSSFGAVTYQSAAYVAGYCLKKVVGCSDAADRLRGRRYSRVDMRTGEVVNVVPEFGRMSLKPGIGFNWFKRFWRDVYSVRDGVVLKGGYEVPSPRYYDKLLADMCDSDGPYFNLRLGLDVSASMLDLQGAKEVERYEKGLEFSGENAPARLEAREKCAIARYKQKERRL